MLSRHDLVWLTPAGWDAAPALPQWRERDWPAVVRRHDPGVAHDAVCLGIPLPARQRVALVVNSAEIARTAPPLPLMDAIAAAPPQWVAGLVALQRAAAALDVRVYGSLAMASITGLPYLGPASDIDVLLRPANHAELLAGLALLEEHAQLLPLDGEIVFPSGDAVAWKEWLSARRDQARVLVKSLHAVRLADPAALLAALPT
jgi:phosphoribosyl-dephospho-CoA transferase